MYGTVLYLPFAMRDDPQEVARQQAEEKRERAERHRPRSARADRQRDGAARRAPAKEVVASDSLAHSLVPLHLGAERRLRRQRCRKHGAAIGLHRHNDLRCRCHVRVRCCGLTPIGSAAERIVALDDVISRM